MHVENLISQYFFINTAYAKKLDRRDYTIFSRARASQRQWIATHCIYSTWIVIDSKLSFWVSRRIARLHLKSDEFCTVQRQFYWDLDLQRIIESSLHHGGLILNASFDAFLLQSWEVRYICTQSLRFITNMNSFLTKIACINSEVKRSHDVIAAVNNENNFSLVFRPVHCNTTKEWR